MSLSRNAGLVFAGSCLLLVAPACGSSEGSHAKAGDDASAGSAGSSTSGSGSSGPDLVGLGGNQSSGGVSSSTGGDCAGELIDAKRLPLDMYVMLDVSGSMLQGTEGDLNVTKWQAVSSALADFVSADASAGIGIGLQVFPLRHPDAPASCTNDAACGAFGPCLAKMCWSADALTPCESDNDCGVRNDCVTFGYCANNELFSCPSVGADCGTDPDTGKALGACTAQTPQCMMAGDCRAVDYATPAVPIATLPGAKAALLAAIQNAKPDRNGLTPTGPALAGAISQSSTWAKAHPERQVVAVLATDGAPTLKATNQVCDGVTAADVDAVAQLAARGKAGTPSISTFVIGVVGPNDAEAAATLQNIAKAGGGAQSFVVDTRGNVQAQFRAALDQIRAAGLSCELAVPQATTAQAVNYQMVNVDFTSKTGEVQHLLNVASAAGCTDAPMQRGWYYDVPASPTRILVCPTTCSEFQATDMGSVKISLGCETRSIVK